MSIPVSINDRLEAAALKAEGGSEIMRRFANDPVGSSIDTESGPLPSIKEWLAQQGDALLGLPTLSGRVDVLETLVDPVEPAGGASMLGRGVLAIDAVADLQNVPRKTDLRVLVKGYSVGSNIGGGEFYWDPTSTATDSGIAVAVSGVALGRWVKRRHGIRSIHDFGVSITINGALAAANTALSAGEQLAIPAGSYSANAAYTQTLQLMGESKAAVIMAAGGAGVVLTLGRHVPDWDYHAIKSLTIDGNSKASDGVDFESTEALGPNFGGRWSFEGVTFRNCNAGANHKSGNIGNRFRDCHFRFNNYGVRHVDSPTGNMHSGAQYYEGCEFSSNSLAAVYVRDGQDGSGQYTFNNCIIEGNPGFGVFMDLQSIAPFAGVVFDNVWFEANASSGSVLIDSVSYTPRDIYLANAKIVNFRGCYLKNIQLVNSTVIADGCRIDDATGTLNLVLDTASQLICTALFSNGQTSGVPFVNSIARNGRQTSGTSNHSWRGPLKTHKEPAKATVVYANNYDGAGPFAFTGTASVNATSVSDGVIHSTCAELTILNGQTLLSSTNVGNATPGKWAVWGIHAKLVSGSVPNTADFGGGSEKFGNVYLRAGEWVCSYGLAQVRSTPTASSRLRFINSTGASITVRLADMFVVEFDTEAEALAFCNARAIPK